MEQGRQEQEQGNEDQLRRIIYSVRQRRLGMAVYGKNKFCNGQTGVPKKRTSLKSVFFLSVIIRHLFECNFLCSGLYRQGIISFLKGLKSITPNAGRNVQLLKDASVIRSGGDWRKVCFKTVEKLPVMD